MFGLLSSMMYTEDIRQFVELEDEIKNDKPKKKRKGND